MTEENHQVIINMIYSKKLKIIDPILLVSICGRRLILKEDKSCLFNPYRAHRQCRSITSISVDHRGVRLDVMCICFM